MAKAKTREAKVDSQRGTQSKLARFLFPNQSSLVLLWFFCVLSRSEAESPQEGARFGRCQHHGFGLCGADTAV
jgi:hypothetical protein